MARVYAVANEAPLCRERDHNECSELCRGRSLRTLPAVELINSYTLDLLELRSMAHISLETELISSDWGPEWTEVSLHATYVTITYCADIA